MSDHDKDRLDWLEWMARKRGGLLLHAETGSTGRRGLGLTRRDLRKAIDEAMRHDEEWRAHLRDLER